MNPTTGIKPSEIQPSKIAEEIARWVADTGYPTLRNARALESEVSLISQMLPWDETRLVTSAVRWRWIARMNNAFITLIVLVGTVVCLFEFYLSAMLGVIAVEFCLVMLVRELGSIAQRAFFRTSVALAVRSDNANHARTHDDHEASPTEPAGALTDREVILHEIEQFRAHMNDSHLEGPALESEVSAIRPLLAWNEARLRRSFANARRLAFASLFTSGGVIVAGVGLGTTLIYRGEDGWVQSVLGLIAGELVVLMAGRVAFAFLQRSQRRSLVALSVVVRERSPNP